MNLLKSIYISGYLLLILGLTGYASWMRIKVQVPWHEATHKYRRSCQ